MPEIFEQEDEGFGSKIIDLIDNYDELEKHLFRQDNTDIKD